MVNVSSMFSQKAPDVQLFTTWKEQLRQLSSSLNALTTTTEDEFLAIGRAMTDFHERTGEITRMLSSLLRIMSGNDIARTIHGIGDIQDRIKDNLSGAENAFQHGLKILQQTLEIMHGIKKPLDNFKKVVKILKILSISTKIESAQLSQDQTGFFAIAADVEKLSVEIHEEIQKISKKILLLDSIIGRNISHISSLDKNLHIEIYTILEDIRLSLILLKDKNELSRKEADLISAQSEEISRHIGEVVVSMQFHDITRQTIEHVREALDNLTQKLSVGDIEKMENDSKHTHIINGVGDICELQWAQLNDTKQRITGATRNIIDHLLQAKEHIVGASHKVESLAGFADESSLSFLSKVETGISTAVLSLQTFTKASHELSETMDIFLKTTADVSGSVNDIEQIGEEIELIAFNARIKTAHTGDEGAPLGVIAEAIQRLSSDANTQKMTISTALNEVMLTARDVRSYTHTDTGCKASEASDVVADFGVFTNILRVTNEKIQVLLNNIDKLGKQLVGDIERTVSGITVHEKFERIINNALSILDVILRESRQMAPRIDSDNRLGYLRRLEDNYTMHRERRIHSQFPRLDTGIMAESGTNKDKIAVKFVNTKPETHQELGDNVELF